MGAQQTMVPRHRTVCLGYKPPLEVIRDIITPQRAGCGGGPSGGVLDISLDVPGNRSCKDSLGKNCHYYVSFVQVRRIGSFDIFSESGT